MLRSAQKVNHARAFFYAWLLVILATPASAVAVQSYRLTGLGYATSRATDINDLGQVVGVRTSPTGGGFMWDPVSGFTDIAGTPAAINNRGEVVGSIPVNNGWVSNSFIWDSTNGLRELVVSGFSYRENDAFGINDAGQVTGWMHRPATTEAYLWDEATGMVFLGDLPGTNTMSYGHGINNAGQVVGEGAGTDPNGFEAFVWDPVGGFTGLGGTPTWNGSVTAIWSAANAINDLGQVVGIDSTSAFIWDATNGMRHFSLLGEPLQGALNPLAINELGQVVGGAQAGAPGIAFLWDETNGVQRLGDLVDGSGAGWVLEEAAGINELGQIVGYGVNPAGQTEAFLLTPIVPEPGSALLCATALGAIGWWRRTRRVGGLT